jgi:hypothetical protein
MNIISKLQTKYHRKMFALECSKVREVKGSFTSDLANFVVVSQTYSKDVDMYLLAAKSFARYFPPRQFIVVDDGLSPVEQRLISSQLGNVEYRPRKGVINQKCPAGGCWERLLTVADCAENDYVVQLDSDTVTLRSPSQAIDAIRSARAFTLSTKQGREFVSAKAASEFAESVAGGHVQLLAERALVEVAPQSLYIRGCAGFIGMPKNGISREMIESFSQLMEKALPNAIWSQWGSEQFASNYFVASTEGPVALEFERYPYWEKGQNIQQAEFIHFIGTDRFTGPTYRNMAQSIIREMG